MTTKKNIVFTLKESNVSNPVWVKKPKRKQTPKIIQNAVMCPDGTILKSCHRHDFHACGDYFVDGGTDYLRHGYPVDGLKPKSLVLTERDTLTKIKNNLLWGTLGKDGKGPMKYVFLKDCETEHLQSILKIPNVSSLYRYVIESILADRLS